MSGGPSSLRTAAVTLGCGLVLMGSLLLFRGTFTPTGLRSASLLAATHPKTTPAMVSLGTLEAVDDALPARPYRTASLVAELSGDLEPSVPPPPAGEVVLGIDPAEELPAPQPTPPTVELLDAQPPQAAAPNEPSGNVPRAPISEPELARIAAAIEELSRLNLLMWSARPVQEATPPRVDTSQSPPDTVKTALIKIERTEHDRDRFSMEVRQAPVGDVLAALCDLAGIKLELAGGVIGRTTITLRDVTLGEAINTVLQHTDLGIEREEHVLRVMPSIMAEERALHRQPVISRRYQSRTLRATEVVPLIRPLLTPRIGRMSIVPERVATICPEPGAAVKDTLVIVDRAAVHEAVSKLLEELETVGTANAKSPKL